MAPRNSMRTKIWFLEKTTFALKLGQNGRGAKARSRSEGPYGPSIKAIWKVESKQDIVYGLFDFSKPIYYFI